MVPCIVRRSLLMSLTLLALGLFAFSSVHAADSGVAVPTESLTGEEAYRLYVPQVMTVDDRSMESKLIDAEQGGTLQVDNTILAIPPGALSKDTVITLVRPQGSTLGGGGIEHVQMEPDGLRFAKPVTLTLTYTDSPELDEDFINFALYSDSTGEWETLPIVAQDQTANQITVEVSHFSYGTFYTDEPLYVVMELPGKYLRPGDILTRMDPYEDNPFEVNPSCKSTADWLPGHTGIYSETIGTAPYDQPIIESNRFDKYLNGCVQNGGVRSYTYAKFIEESCDFYMGAQRPAGVSAEMQQSARVFATQQLGKGYSLIGQGDWLDNGKCYSCTGLAEDAYEKAGVNGGAGIIPWRPGITPLEMFKRTVPVSEITVQAGEEVRIPVYAILKNDTVFGPDYYERAIFYPTIGGAPAGSQYQGGVFTWTPARADGGKTVTVSFSAEHSLRTGTYTRQQTLTIYVTSEACKNVTEIPKAECEALVALFESTNGTSWYNNDGWLQTDTPCTWYGVTCSSRSVQELFLSENNLRGGIPPELSNLANLKTLDLSVNELSGSIPSELSNLANLGNLVLYENQLSGDIPPELANLANLWTLWLGSNELSGGIPTELGSLTNLHWLHLYGNNLSGSIPPQLGNLSNLQGLTLHYNQLSGGIPSQLGSLSNLELLYLHNNQLSGDIPSELGNVANLHTLYLDENQLSGSIPSQLGNLVNLLRLTLHSNLLSGPLPLSLIALGSLERFWFSDTQLCVPSDSTFQTWLNALEDMHGTGVTCP